MCHGFGAVKEIGADTFAEEFTTSIPVCALVYDNRSLGTSDGLHRQAVIPALQCSDHSDATTHAQLGPEVDPQRVAVWGTSYNGAYALSITAVDLRVKAIVSQGGVTPALPQA
ncbi:hypothetical protein AYO20_08681 [Fonsecaea nubica]|uniref:Xaa-Pro dipeptidyl-peptidase-like domain-containing protein n=1 Tax=Fonsecaea nubica TaxID=856822 RepID=A0A178CMC7_9EURO|nr:hypothetical protein AYO20_08681 [Fonsecaea nubica]OAL30594.1 hypothetical protein AYO20_08681 [Fonsecaea nubica]